MVFRKIKNVGAVLFCALIFSGCQFNNETMKTSTLFAMDTVMELEIAGNEELLPEAEEKIRDLERRLSVTDNDSEISLLNKNKQALLSNDTATILANALSICDETDGALDVSIYPVLKEWGFTTGEYKVPDDTRITELLKEVDYNKINMVSGEEDKENKNDISVQIPENMEVDLGSVVKGYTSTMLYDFFTENGVKSGLINLGGNVQCIGTKPNGEMWNVAIKSPYLDSKTGIIGVLKASDEAVITSGGYERYFEEDGKIYHHIIDPSTGKPADNGLSSVTIIGKDGLKCDGYSTALYIKGLDSAISFWKERDDFEAVFVTSDGNVYVTEGISDRFLLSSEYAQKTIKIISK
ncbi:FAD:protein FMN transferase [Butyrivibrio sp.]|uniref:FAD:protein FMN transferase n=1 Tax=Butyrivibrio sp. TaxID=28121 RepID=UPI0025BF43B8|nr:FAD:protein FMN transferase [Butyrivibrio sp.]